MRILFVTTNDIFQSFGGAIGSKRNYDMLSELYGSDKVDIILLKELPNDTIIQKLIKAVIKYCKKRQFDFTPLFNIDYTVYSLVFNDNSVIGEFTKKLRNKGFKGNIISYFHNCEHALYRQMYSHKSWFIRKPLYDIVKSNEVDTLRYSDVCITLNTRDLNDLQQVYRISFKNVIIPVSMRDRFNLSESSLINSGKKKFTFLGSSFLPNVKGILWFIDNVLPHVDIRLQIIGRGMNRLVDKISSNKVEIYSDVPDVDEFIYKSDCMIYPIFDGSGMKLKTCEAFMFGKNVIGTPEAFMGYEIDDFSTIGACCSTKEEFVNAINNFNLPRFNSNSRELYLSKYSYNASLNRFKDLIEQL